MNNCPICSDDSQKRFLCKVSLSYKTEFDLVECSICGASFFHPLPTQAELTTFYSASYYDFDKSRVEGKGMAFARRLRKWKPSGKFLDVGCATGFFINGIKKHSGWEVYGTDFNKEAIQFARKTLGLNAVQGELTSVGFPVAFFDFVHVNNVLEHVLDPVSLLKECRRIVKPDGIFYISVPNGFNDKLDLINFYRIEHKPARSKNGHIFFLPARTLLKLFEKVQFTVEKKKTYSLKRGFRNISYLPRKRDWKRDYFPIEVPERTKDSEIKFPHQQKRHSDLYYRLRFILRNLLMVPGLHDFGLDFLFILRPKI